MFSLREDYDLFFSFQKTKKKQKTGRSESCILSFSIVAKGVSFVCLVLLIFVCIKLINIYEILIYN